MRRVLIALTALLVVGCWAALRVHRARTVLSTSGSPGTPVPPTGEKEGPTRFLKGQLHAHSNNSGDSQTPPEEVARWYAERGYDFLVLTDHNHVTVAPSPGTLLVIPGTEITFNLRDCQPPPLPGLGCLLHVNALFVDPERARAGASVPRLAEPAERLEAYSSAITLARELGAVAQVNHPNFHYAAEGSLLRELAGRGATLLEVANEAVDSANEGDAQHPSTEVLWDSVLSRGGRLWAVATDDAHHYFDAEAVRARGEVAHVGDRGFIMVRARRTAADIRRAIEAGDFYASTGVLLSRLEVTPDALLLAVEPQAGPHVFTFIGREGQALDVVKGTEASFPLQKAREGYVRAVITSPEGRKAWTQPTWP